MDGLGGQFAAMTESVGSSGPAVSKPADGVDAALARLLAALTSLEVAAGRRREGDMAQAALAESYAAMQDDRSRLALELDAALARGKRLELAGEEVARRLEAAGAAIAALAQGAEGSE